MSTVKRLRQITGLTQAQLADLAGTSQPTIAAYETGSKVPSWRTLQRLARASGLNALVSFVPEMTLQRLARASGRALVSFVPGPTQPFPPSGHCDAALGITNRCVGSSPA